MTNDGQRSEREQSSDQLREESGARQPAEPEPQRSEGPGRQQPEEPGARLSVAARQPPTGGNVPDQADLIQSVTRLDRAIKERRDTDTVLVNWWLYVLLLGPFTLGIYGIFLFFKRIARIDGFSHRKQAYYQALVEWTQRHAAAEGKENLVHHDLADLSGEISRAYTTDMRPIKAGLSLVLSLVTIGIYGFVVVYRENRYWWDAQVFEQDFDDKLSQVWIKLGILRYPVTFQSDQSKKRSFPTYLILSFVTIGIWGLVWDYKIHTDPDNLYGEFHSIEDSVLQTVRTAGSP